MKDNQKKYLDKVVNLIVRGTEIDYDKEEVNYPFLTFSILHIFHHFNTIPLYPLAPISSSFTNYCIDTYGLGENEIEYVWVEYKDKIKDKLEYER